MLDGNRLGLVGGAVISALVLGLCFYVQETDGFTAFTRAGWSFVAAYGVIFLLVRLILRTTLFEAIEQRERKKAEAADHPKTRR